MSGIFWVLVVIAVLMFVAVCFLWDIFNQTRGTNILLSRISIRTRDLRHHVYRIETVIGDRDFNDVRPFVRRDIIQPFWGDE